MYPVNYLVGHHNTEKEVWMKRLLAFLFLYSCVSVSYASAPPDYMSYDKMLQWSKEQIIHDAKNDLSQEQIDDALKDFPVIVSDECDVAKLAFLKNTPQCGNVNCKYLAFRVTSPPHYQYLTEIEFAAEHLFCYRKDSHGYLVTSQHDTNASNIVYLDKIVGNKLVRVGKRKIDLSDDHQKEFYDSLWDKKIGEQELIKSFKK
jgi:hypothetical protein